MSTDKIHFSEHFGIRVNLIIGELSVPGILDTGADTVCIPESLAQRLVGKGEAVKISETYVSGANSRQKANVYSMSVGVEGLEGFAKRVAVIGLPTTTALLGRNWLKYVRFTYDGVADEVVIDTGE